MERFEPVIVTMAATARFVPAPEVALCHTCRTRLYNRNAGFTMLNVAPECSLRTRSGKRWKDPGQRWAAGSPIYAYCRVCHTLNIEEPKVRIAHAN